MNRIYRQYLTIPIQLPLGRVIQCNNIDVKINALISILGNTYVERHGQVYSIGNNVLESRDNNLYMINENNVITCDLMTLSMDLNIKLKAEYLDAVFDRGDHNIVMRVIRHDYVKYKRVYIEWNDPKLKNINSYTKKLQSAVNETNTIHDLGDVFNALKV